MLIFYSPWVVVAVHPQREDSCTRGYQPNDVSLLHGDFNDTFRDHDFQLLNLFNYLIFLA